MFKEIDLQHHAVVVVGFNRLLSITRLLKSLSIAYYDEEVALVISIDKSDDQDVYSFVDNFQWKHGNKYVIIQEKRRGLKEHIYRCGDLSKFFKSVTILEDDMSVSPYFFSYVKNAVEVYGDDENVAGISLYKNEFNGFNSLPLYFLIMVMMSLHISQLQHGAKLLLILCGISLEHGFLIGMRIFRKSILIVR